MSNHVCEICHPRSFQHVHGAMKRKAFITVAMVRSPDPSCWYPRSHVGRSLPPYLALPPSVPPPPRSLQPAALAFPLQSEDFAFPVPSRTSAFPPATPSAYSAAFTIQVQLAATRSLLKGHISETSSYPFGHSSPCPTPRVSARANRTPVLPTPRSGHPWWVNTDPCGALTHGGRRTPQTGVGSWFCFALPRASYQAWARIWPTPPPPVIFCAPALTRFSSLINPQSDKIYVLPLPPLRGVIHEGSDFTWPPAVCLVPVCAVDIGGPPWSPPHGA